MAPPFQAPLERRSTVMQVPASMMTKLPPGRRWWHAAAAAIRSDPGCPLRYSIRNGTLDQGSSGKHSDRWTLKAAQTRFSQSFGAAGGFGRFSQWQLSKCHDVHGPSGAQESGPMADILFHATSETSWISPSFTAAYFKRVPPGSSNNFTSS